MNTLALLGGALAGFAIPWLILGLAAKYIVLRLYVPHSTWSELTPRMAVQGCRQRRHAASCALTYVYALSQWIAAALFFSGGVLFLIGYVPTRFAS